MKTVFAHFEHGGFGSDPRSDVPPGQPLQSDPLSAQSSDWGREETPMEIGMSHGEFPEGHHASPFNEDVTHEGEILKVSARSRPSAVAGAIAGVLRQSEQVEVQAIGAGATNQAIKAVAIARGYLTADGFDLVAIPSFIEVTIDGEERTAVRLLVRRHPRTEPS